jgi:proteic killer suppression protein
MIKSFANTATRQFVETGKSKFSGMDAKVADARIHTLKSLKDLAELAQYKRLRLHGLSGANKGFWSIDINGPWRIWFRFDGDCHDVQIIDPH